MTENSVIEYLIEENGKRIDAWLSDELTDMSRSYIRKLIDDGSVTVNDEGCKANYKLRAGDNVKVVVPPPVEMEVLAEDIPLNILYEDNDILVVDKPKGMVVHPAVGNYTGTLVNAILYHCKDNLSDINGVIRPGIVHRIDKDTSGVLVVAKNNEAHRVLSETFKKHDIKRVYNAVVQGIVQENAGEIDAPIGRHENNRIKMAVNTKNGRTAITRFKVLDRFESTTFIEVELETGRTHQIRVHLSYIGYPVLGDDVYGKKKNAYGLDGQTLHAKILGFNHPITGEYMEFESKLPEYFEKLLGNISGNIKN